MQPKFLIFEMADFHLWKAGSKYMGGFWNTVILEVEISSVWMRLTGALANVISKLLKIT